jgi:NitT/TauT family transport system substrate-binding protein
VQANDIDAAKVRIENVGFPVREAMLAQRQLDAITGFSFSSFINLKWAGVPEDDISVMLMADYGVALYGNAIIVNTEFAEANPEAVKGFLRAFNKGVKETIADPAASVEYVVMANPAVTKKAELERLQMAINQNILTGDVKTKGLGGIDPERMSKAIDQLALTYEFKEKPNAESVFDPFYLPEASERAIE